MKTPAVILSSCLSLVWVASSAAPWPQFRHHFIARDLPTDTNGTGDYGLTALVDLNRDSHPDFVLGGRGVKPERLYWFEYRAPGDWVKHEIGRDYQSDVGLAALDVDGDGWLDLVCSGVWFRNPGSRGEQPWERLEFAKDTSGAHDVVAADIDGDGRLDIVTMGDARTKLNALCWFKIPTDPRRAWERHDIGPPVHGAIAPAGVADIDGDGDLDVVRADTWFENKDGKGRDWIAHKNISLGRTGPFGVCVRTAIMDIDGDGKKEIVMCDADITGSKAFVLRNVDGKGGEWKTSELPLGFESGSFHSLAVADLNGDGLPDIVVNEQEELLPEGRTNPRWIAWENLGQGKFAEHILLDAKLGGHELQAADVDGDGDIDLCSKPWGVRPWNGAAGRMHVDFLENLLRK
jgi:hypothetical protein